MSNKKTSAEGPRDAYGINNLELQSANSVADSYIQDLKRCTCCTVLSSTLLKEIGFLFWYFEARVRYCRKKVYVRYLID